MWALPELADPRMWDAQQPMPLSVRSWREAKTGDLVWAKEYLVPWVLQRIRHESSADGIMAKRPTAGPVFGPHLPPQAT